MKQIFLVILAILFLSLFAIYFRIPGEIHIRKSSIIKAPESVFFTYLYPKKELKKWWPGEAHGKLTKSGYLLCTYKGVGFKFRQQNYYSIEAEANLNNITSIGTVSFFPIDEHSTRVNWQSVTQTSKNPFLRLKQYQTAKKTNQRVDEVISHLKLYLEDEKKLYGITIQRTKVKDTLVLTTKIITPKAPSEKVVGDLIHELRSYIEVSKAAETSFPILNISKVDHGYQTMVGIPVNRFLANKGKMTTKRMIYQANLLMTEVRGGRNTINHAINQLESYMLDKKLSSPAIPFESLVTNRLTQPDTTKWITRIYYPIY